MFSYQNMEREEKVIKCRKQSFISMTFLCQAITLSYKYDLISVFLAHIFGIVLKRFSHLFKFTQQSNILHI